MLKKFLIILFLLFGVLVAYSCSRVTLFEFPKIEGIVKEIAHSYWDVDTIKSYSDYEFSRTIENSIDSNQNLAKLKKITNFYGVESFNKKCGVENYQCDYTVKAVVRIEGNGKGVVVMTFRKAGDLYEIHNIEVE